MHVRADVHSQLANLIDLVVWPGVTRMHKGHCSLGHHGMRTRMKTCKQQHLTARGAICLAIAWLGCTVHRAPCLVGIETHHTPTPAKKVCATVFRQRGDSNPCGQSPMDFESISLAARTHCLGRTFEKLTSSCTEVFGLDAFT